VTFATKQANPVEIADGCGVLTFVILERGIVVDVEAGAVVTSKGK